LIKVEGFEKAYQNVVAVAGLSFEVNPGDIVGLVGPNGAGKTTTMRAISGIIPPTRGVLSLGGHDVAQEPIAAKRLLAYVPDDPKLFDALTVWEHLEFIASAYRVRDFRGRAEELLARFELTEKRDTMASELSRGMRQKAAVCCAYLHEPRAVLLDEPLTGLDPRGIRTMNASVREMAAQGVAFMVSSHLLSLVENLCNRLLILHRGQRLFFGDIAEARAAFAGEDTDASLEEVFFRATEGRPAPPPSPAGD
jgi:ABC-2 type transport system ATP-binding protein